MEFTAAPDVSWSLHTGLTVGTFAFANCFRSAPSCWKSQIIWGHRGSGQPGHIGTIKQNELKKGSGWLDCISIIYVQRSDHSPNASWHFRDSLHINVGLKIYGVMRHLFFNFDEVATVLALFTGVTEGPASEGFFFFGDFFFGVLLFTGDFFFFLGDFCLFGLFVSVRKHMQ